MAFILQTETWSTIQLFCTYTFPFSLNWSHVVDVVRGFMSFEDFVFLSKKKISPLKSCSLSPLCCRVWELFLLKTHHSATLRKFIVQENLGGYFGNSVPAFFFYSLFAVTYNVIPYVLLGSRRRKDHCWKKAVPACRLQYNEYATLNIVVCVIVRLHVGYQLY